MTREVRMMWTPLGRVLWLVPEPLHRVIMRRTGWCIVQVRDRETTQALGYYFRHVTGRVYP